MSVKMAFNPLPFYLTTMGWQPELAPPLAAILAVTRDAGYEAIHAEVPPDMTVADYAELLRANGLRPAPGYFQAGFAETASLPLIIDDARRIAGQHAELGLDRIFIAEQFGVAAPRLARPAQGAEADAGRLQRIAEGLGQVAAAMRAEGVIPCLHPHVGTWIETTDEADAVLAAISADDLLLGPDTGHIAWTGADPAAYMLRHRGRIGAVHIKDIRLSIASAVEAEGATYSDAGARHIWTEPGRGDIDYDAVFVALAGFDGWFVVEVDIADQPSVAETAQIAASWLRPRLEARH